MIYYLFKIAISAVLIVTISEVAKRSALVGSLLASIPFVSILAMIWLYVETKDLVQVSNLSIGIFWLVLPSLIFFISMPVFLKINLNFYLAMSLSIIITMIGYLVTLMLVKRVLFEN